MFSFSFDLFLHFVFLFIRPFFLSLFSALFMQAGDRRSTRRGERKAGGREEVSGSAREEAENGKKRLLLDRGGGGRRINGRSVKEGSLKESQAGGEKLQRRRGSKEGREGKRICSNGMEQVRKTMKKIRKGEWIEG